MESVDSREREPEALTATQPVASLTTIEVSKVKLAKVALRQSPYKIAVEALLAKPSPEWLNRFQSRNPEPSHPIEACSRYHGQLVAGVKFHPFVAAVHLAFHDHRPLILSPDMLWLLVGQGLANHINARAEELRLRFVEHSGRVNLEVQRNDFTKGSPENPWPEVFGEFSKQIRERIGATTHDLLLPRFSTTGPVERAAAEIVLLDAMQCYFSNTVTSLCGIPHIVLEGTIEDWSALATRTRDIGQFGLDWWTNTLALILDEFVAAARGQVNTRFWQSLYKLNDASGGPYVSGWITAFFPYLTDSETERASRRNPWLTNGGEELQDLLYPPEQDSADRYERGPSTEDFPSGLARAPFHWKYHARTFQMEFLGGFVGVRQEPDTLQLRPDIGWVVREQAAASGEG